MRYRLRTLLILLAVGPPVVAAVLVEPQIFAVAMFAASAMAIALSFCYAIAFGFLWAIAGVEWLARRILRTR